MQATPPDRPPPEAIPGYGTMKANGGLSVAGQSVQVGTVVAGLPSQGAVGYLLTQTKLWVFWADGRQTSADLPTPLSDEQWRDQRCRAGRPDPLDPAAIPGLGTVDPSGRLYVAGRKVRVGTVVAGRPTRGPVGYLITQTKLWVFWADGRQISADLPTPLDDEQWRDQRRWVGRPGPPDPEAIPGHGVVTAVGLLSVAGQPVRVGTVVASLPTAGPVGYLFTRTRVWVFWDDGRRTSADLPTALSHERWQQHRHRAGWPDPPDPEAIPGCGVVDPSGQLLVAGQPVQVGTTVAGRSTAGPVRYEFTQTTVWLAWHDGRRAIVNLPTPLSHDQWQGQLRPADWSDPPHPEAIPGYGVVTDDGHLLVAGQPVRVGTTVAGRSTAGPVGYLFTQTTVWLTWYDGSRTTAPLPHPLSHQQWVAEHRRVGRSDPPHPEAIPGYGVVTDDGQLLVAGQPVQLATLIAGRSTVGPVRYEFTQTTVCLTWHDGRHATANLPTPLSHEQWQQHRRRAGWPDRPDREAITGYGVVTADGQLSVAGQLVQFAILIAGRSTRGPVESRYNQTTLWLAWHDGRLMIVDLPTPLDDEQWQTQRSQAGLAGPARPGGDPRLRRRGPRRGPVGGRATGAGWHIDRRPAHRGPGRVPVQPDHAVAVLARRQTRHRQPAHPAQPRPVARAPPPSRPRPYPSPMCPVRL